MKFVYVKPGAFMMGSDEWERTKPVHKVRFEEGFYMQTTEVTVGQWRRFIEDTNFKTDAEKNGWSWVWDGKEWIKKEGAYWGNPGFSQYDDSPVTCVSWNDIKRFIEWLSAKDGKKYRLPTEAEWEYAARGGEKSKGYKYSGSNNLDEVAWWEGISEKRTHSVAGRGYNELGIYDMSGNVWEWCEDKWHNNYDGAPSDGSAWITGEKDWRVLRGGSWCNGGGVNFRPAYRYDYFPYTWDNSIGFRCVRIL